MKRCIRALRFLLILMCVPVYAQEAAPNYVREAQDHAAQLQGELKKALQSAIKAGGFANAIDVCHEQAPKIAQSLGDETGWTIRRTSLKTRNPFNQPTQMERNVMNEFATRHQSGEPIAQIEWWRESRDEVAYMKVIPMMGVCTTCHGEQLDPSVQEAISKRYPEDKATGFRIGDIRGAFTMTKRKVNTDVVHH